MKRVTSIVILTYNQLEFTKLCLDSIRKYTEAGSYELIIVDNASTDGTVEWLKQQDDIICIFNQDNKGFPAGCNQGLALAQGTELLLLNNDVIVTPRWLEQLRTALYADARTGAVSCVTNKCSNLQQIDVPYTTLDELADFGERFNHLNPALWQRRNKLVGFCFLFKREIYELLGGLDEVFTPGNYEDDDYSLRIMQQGYQLLLCGDTFIHHFGGASFLQKEKESAKVKTDKAIKYNALLKKNGAIFADKWHTKEYYGDVAFLHELWGKLPSTGKAMYVAEGTYGAEPFMMQGQQPGLVFHVVTSDELEAVVLSQRFFTQIANIQTVDILSCFDEKYDLIFYKVDICRMYPVMLERLLNGLANWLNPQGKLYFYNDGKVVSMTTGQEISVIRN